MYRRRGLVLSALGAAAVVLILSAHWVSYAQQPAATGSPASNYTGDTSRMDTADILLGRRRFEAGARSAWHIHPGGQLILIEEGRGRVQRRGEPVLEFAAGESNFTAAGIPHWHGAAPDHYSVQSTMSFGGIGPWLEPVSDEEYSAPARR